MYEEERGGEKENGLFFLKNDISDYLMMLTHQTKKIGHVEHEWGDGEIRRKDENGEKKKVMDWDNKNVFLMMQS